MERACVWGSDLPKQFLPVGGKPVLMHTLEVFRKYDAAIQLILVLPREQQDFWKQLCREHDFDVEHRVADGGETRFHSVKNGLALVQAPGLVGSARRCPSVCLGRSDPSLL